MSRRFWRRLFGAVLVLALVLALVLTGSLIAQLFEYWQQQALLRSSQQNEQLALHMETLLDGLQNHVKRLQHDAHLALHADVGAPVLPQFMRPAIASGVGGYTLDELQQSTPSAQLGNVYMAVPPSTPAAAAELRIVWALFPLAAATHLSDSALQWSYYVSLQLPLVAIYPYRSTERLLRDNNLASLPVFFAEFLAAEIQQRIAGELAEQNAPLWRPPHIDKAGAGWVVALVAPVRRESQTIGAVSADVRLPFLSHHLAKLTTAPERTLLIDNEQRVLADSRLSSETSVRLARLGERLPASLAALVPTLTRANPGWSSAADYHVLVRPLAHSQWSLVRLIPSDELLFDTRLRAMAVALPVVLLAGLLLLVWWWRRRDRVILLSRQPATAR